MNEKMKTDERMAFEQGFCQMIQALHDGKVPDQESIRMEFNEFLSKVSKAECVQKVERSGDLEIARTVSAVRSQGEIPGHRFMGSVMALLAYSKSCRDKGLIPQEMRFDDEGNLIMRSI